MKLISYVIPERGTNGSGYNAGCTRRHLLNLDHVIEVRHTEGLDYIEVQLANGEWLTLFITLEQWIEQTA